MTDTIRASIRRILLSKQGYEIGTRFYYGVPTYPGERIYKLSYAIKDEWVEEDFRAPDRKTALYTVVTKLHTQYPKHLILLR